MENYTVRHELNGAVIGTYQGLSPDDAYERFVLHQFGNGTCGFCVEVVTPSGTVIDF